MSSDKPDHSAPQVHSATNVHSGKIKQRLFSGTNDSVIPFLSPSSAVLISMLTEEKKKNLKTNIS